MPGGQRLSRLLHGRSVVAGASAPASPAGALSGEEAEALQKLLRWPPASLFPALDIARLAALNEAAAAQLAQRMGALDAAAAGGEPQSAFCLCQQPENMGKCTAWVVQQCRCVGMSRPEQGISHRAWSIALPQSCSSVGEMGCLGIHPSCGSGRCRGLLRAAQAEHSFNGCLSKAVTW